MAEGSKGVQQQKKKKQKAVRKQMIQQEQMIQLLEAVIRESKEMVAVTLARLLRLHKRMMMKMRKKKVTTVKA